MEHGSQDLSASTFSLADEDHTLANSVRFTLNQDPRVTFCGYSIPHPSDAKVNIRVQTTEHPQSLGVKTPSPSGLDPLQRAASAAEDPDRPIFSYHKMIPRQYVTVRNPGDPASEVLKDACQDLMLMSQHVRSTFDQAVADYRKAKSREDEIMG